MTTKIDLIKSVARSHHDLIVDGIPASYCATYADFDRLIQPREGQLIGRNFYVYEGTGAGQDRIIADFLPANNRVVFDQPLTVTLTGSTGCVIFNYWEKDDYDNAIDRAVGRAQQIYYPENVATLQLAGSQYEYPIPSIGGGFQYVSQLRLVPSGHTDYAQDDEVERLFEIPSHRWRVEKNAVGTAVLVFDSRKISMNNYNNEWLRVIGQTKMEALGTDNSTVPVDVEEFLIANATARLAQQRVNEDKEWTIKTNNARSDSKFYEDHIHSHISGREVP